MNLNLVGHLVERVAFDFGVTILFDNGLEVRIETTFTVHAVDSTPVEVNPPNYQDAAARLLSVLQETVTSAHVDETTGELRLEFEGGRAIRVPSSEMFEAWSLTSLEGVRATSLPGGSLSLWES